jgi:hypothetical protein
MRKVFQKKLLDPADLAQKVTSNSVENDVIVTFKAAASVKNKIYRTEKLVSSHKTSHARLTATDSITEISE